MSNQIHPAADRVAREGNIVRKTNAHSGRSVAITPANSSMKHLCYARIKLDATVHEVSFNTSNKETAFICLSGQAEFKIGENQFSLNKDDAVYVPRGSTVQIQGKSADLAEFSAQFKRDYPLQIIRYAYVQAY